MLSFQQEYAERIARMKLPGWFNTSGSDAFAREISEEFSRTFPAGEALSPRVSEQRLLQAIEVLGNRAAKFNRQTPMGWYRKAEFMKTIKECLFDKGYSEEWVNRVVYAVVLRMARRDGRGTR